MQKPNENERAERLSLRINEYHKLLAETYENLVDREFTKVDRDVRFLIMELRCVLKSIEEDDF
jgi:hypothetical protein